MRRGCSQVSGKSSLMKVSKLTGDAITKTYPWTNGQHQVHFHSETITTTICSVFFPESWRNYL